MTRWKAVIASAVGLGVFLLLFPYSGADSDPPFIFNVFGHLISRSPDISGLQLKALLGAVASGALAWLVSGLVFRWLAAPARSRGS